MIEEALHYLQIISRTNVVIATALAVIASLMVLFYFIYLFKNKGD